MPIIHLHGVFQLAKHSVTLKFISEKMDLSCKLEFMEGIQPIKFTTKLLVAHALPETTKRNIK